MHPTHDLLTRSEAVLNRLVIAGSYNVAEMRELILDLREAIDRNIRQALSNPGAARESGFSPAPSSQPAPGTSLTSEESASGSNPVARADNAGAVTTAVQPGKFLPVSDISLASDSEIQAAIDPQHSRSLAAQGGERPEGAEGVSAPAPRRLFGEELED